jgi:hypothetical protein
LRRAGWAGVGIGACVWSPQDCLRLNQEIDKKIAKPLVEASYITTSGQRGESRSPG